MPDKPAITVREATHADIPALVRLNSAMAWETESKSLDQDLLTNGTTAVFDDAHRGFYLVAQAAGRVVASLLITYEWSDWRNASFWWVQSVYVEPEWRRQGVYTAMHHWVHDTARSQPEVCGIRLYVDRDNLAAQSTYAKLGMASSRYDLFEQDFIFPD